MKVHSVASALALGALLAALPALAEGDEVGKIALLNGAGTRSAEGQDTPLSQDLPIRVGDKIVLTKGDAKLLLNDQSAIYLSVAEKGDKRAELTITEAAFENQVRKGFMAKLGVGKLWAKVKKAVAGSDAKFEVSTDRAVAGVRGTIFRVDAVTLVKGSKPSTSVWVTRGVVHVAASGKVKDVSRKKGPRTQVPGPQEISKEQWEARFAELQKGMAVRISGDTWEELTQAAPKDKFSKFIAANDDMNDQ